MTCDGWLYKKKLYWDVLDEGHLVAQSENFRDAAAAQECACTGSYRFAWEFRRGLASLSAQCRFCTKERAEVEESDSWDVDPSKSQFRDSWSDHFIS